MNATYQTARKAAKTSANRKAALKTKNDALKVARQVRQATYQQALSTLKMAKQQAKNASNLK